MEQKYIGSPLDRILRVSEDDTFDWNDYESIFVYIYTSKLNVLKFSLVEKSGYLPLEILSATELRFFAAGVETKKLCAGNTQLEIYIDEGITPLFDTPTGVDMQIEWVENKIKAEVV